MIIIAVLCPSSTLLCPPLWRQDKNRQQQQSELVLTCCCNAVLDVKAFDLPQKPLFGAEDLLDLVFPGQGSCHLLQNLFQCRYLDLGLFQVEPPATCLWPLCTPTSLAIYVSSILNILKTRSLGALGPDF